jgi:sec-independent protein translocase protein TatA
MMGDVAKGLKSFKAGMSDDDDAKQPPPQRPAEPRQIPPQSAYDAQPPIDITPQPAEPPRASAPPRDDSAR